MPKHCFWKTSGKGDGSHLVKQIIFSFSPRHPACGILVPLPRIKPAPPALEVWSLNHWTSGEVPQVDLRNQRVLAAIVLVFHFPFPICLSLGFLFKEFLFVRIHNSQGSPDVQTSPARGCSLVKSGFRKGGFKPCWRVILQGVTHVRRGQLDLGSVGRVCMKETLP